MLLYEDARRRAATVLAHFPIARRDINGLVQIAAHYGAAVDFRPLDSSVSGLVLKEDNGQPIIYINSLEPLVRQRFTLAHEIGHLVERREVANDTEYSFIDYRSTDPESYDLHEFYADEFAGSLLMPAHEFLPMLEEKGEFATAVHFGVSAPAVRKRAERLEKTPEVY